MSTLEDRKKGFEEKYAHDKEFEFKVVARRNKLLGLWAAEKLGLDGEDAAAYAREVIESDFEEAGHEDVFNKVWGDFQAKSVDQSEHQVRRQMADLLEEAKHQLYEE
ncbi:MAG: DUF1476 domain-containing protein [Alphaproteobacteria bacterium]|jgi:hypothetical protein|nr:DUF1476 domain-containing protein [Alphaproteobacteria bacterium]